MILTTALLSVALASAHAPPLQDTTAITRAQAIAQALAHNPQLEIASEQTAQARARVVTAKALPDPGISGSLDDLSGPVRFGSRGGHTIGVGMDIPFPDKLRLAGKVATADVRASEFSYDLTRQQIAAQTSQAYDALLVALRHSADLTEAHALALDFVKKTQARFDAGTVARLDVIKATVDASQVENDRIASERDVAVGRAALNRLMGRPLGTVLQPADSLMIPDVLPDLQGLTTRAATLRPELRAIQAQAAGARASTRLAKEYWLPDLSLGMEGSTGSGAPAAFTTSLSFGVPLFFWQHQRGEVAEATHFEREIAAQTRDLTAQVEQEVATAYATAGTALRQAAFIRDQLLPATREAYRIASVSYTLGGASALEVLDARRALIDAQSQFAEALGAANDAVADLELALGGSLSPNSSGGSNGR